MWQNGSRKLSLWLPILFTICLLSSESHAEKLKCPEVKTLFDVPAATTCRELAKLLRSDRVCSGFKTIDTKCCGLLQTALGKHCNCWPGFRKPVLAAFQRMHDSCLEFQAGRGPAAAEGFNLFVGVLSAGKNAEARQAIRETWGTDERLHRVMFVLAKPVEEDIFDAVRKEAAAKGDVVVLPQVWESYFNITHQTLEVCRIAAADKAVTHVLKVDDDSYVRVSKLLDRLKHSPIEKLFLGFIESPGGGPHRNPSSQWYVTEDEWPTERYPPWAHGAGYVLSKDLVTEIAAGAAQKASNHRMFKLEDIAMGSWIEFIAEEKNWKLELVRDERFNFNGCNVDDIVSHYVKPEYQRCIFRNNGNCCGAGLIKRNVGK